MMMCCFDLLGLDFMRRRGLVMQESEWVGRVVVRVVLLWCRNRSFVVRESFRSRATQSHEHHLAQ
jgi:hypothetical protein